MRVNKPDQQIDARLEDVVARMFDRCFDDSQYKQALGIALESHRMDKVREAIERAPTDDDMLSYCFELAPTVIHSRDFRQRVFRELADIYKSKEVPNYISICQCLLYLDDAQSIATILEGLLKKDNCDDWLMAYQVAYELSEHENQPFLLRVISGLPAVEESSGTGDVRKIGLRYWNRLCAEEWILGYGYVWKLAVDDQIE